MDLKAFLAGEDIAVPGRGLGFTERPPRKPIIAAVEGFALAGGTELALATDLIVASREARFGLPEVKRGLVAGGGGLFRLPQRIPYQKAMELALTGDSISAEEGCGLGLVNVVTQPGEAVTGALELAGRIARNGPLAVSATKQIVASARDWSSEEAFGLQGPVLAPVFASEDAREGAAAFAEKRQPLWRGR
jgi:enoyl-CoA hydratase